jgi:glycosyltransferase involved in cell wall biosynthesis
VAAVKILHVGSGFVPWRIGGLVAYAEDLMQAQVRRGDEVACFFSGRHYPYVSGPRLRRWRHRGASMFEIVNSPLGDHGRQPDLEISEPRLERMFARTLAELRPAVVHVQELAGLPSSLLEVARDSGVPVVMTLHDYFLLCSTFKLFDSEGRVCLRREIGADCVATTATAPGGRAQLVNATIALDLARAKEAVPLLRHVSFAPLRPVIEPVVRRASRAPVAASPQAQRAPAGGSAAGFQRRRDANVARLNRVDRLVAVSHRVSEIYGLLGVDRERIRVVHPTLERLERMRPRRATGRGPVTFAALGGIPSRAKGAGLIAEAAASLVAGGAAGGFRLLAFGHYEDADARRLEGLPGVELRGPYTGEELDDLLEEVDVGIMPSLWEEAYGLAGVEFLAKGIPVIGNAIGGIVDYVRDGETGWLNASCDAAGLAAIMAHLVETPGEVADRSRSVLAARGDLITPIDRHADEIEAIYREAGMDA